MLYIMQSVQRRGESQNRNNYEYIFNGYKVIYIMYMTCIFACRNIVICIHVHMYIYVYYV